MEEADGWLNDTSLQSWPWKERVTWSSGSVVFHRRKLTFHMYTVDSGSWPQSWIQEVVLREQAGRLPLPNLSHDAAL